MGMMPKLLNAVGSIIFSQEEVLADAVSLEEKHVSSENHTGEHKTHIPVISMDKRFLGNQSSIDSLSWCLQVLL